ncbi:MAG TPA: TetR/AcrR family transcriptional regulator [Rhizomicrobium sp.]|nr:TetR/AcrR family transcriptional regulator [Rhizomicrobium sp.]
MNSDSSPPAKPKSLRHALPAHQPRSRETRARILAAAEQEFAEKGYEGARLADIAEAAGCSVGTVYFRFKDKSALFLAIAESFADDARENLKKIFERTSDLAPHDAIRLFVTGAAQTIRSHKGLFRAIMERGFDNPEALRAMFFVREEFAAALQAILKPMSTRNPDLRVRVMTQMVYGFLVAGVLNPQAPTASDEVRAVRELADACVAYIAGAGS